MCEYLTKRKHHCLLLFYWHNINYGFYGIMKIDLFKYSIETVESKSDAKIKKGMKFRNKKKR